MVLSETEAEARLSDLRRQRDAIDRAITDLTLYLELGRRLTGASPDRQVPSGPVPDDSASVRSPTDVPSPDSVRLGRPPVVDPAEHSSARAGAMAASRAVPPAAPETETETETKAMPDARPLSGDPDSGTVPEGALARRYGRALVQAAVAVLEEAGRPLHVSEILGRLGARGFSVPGQQDPVAGLNTRLWKRSGPGGPLRRLGDAVYALPDALADPSGLDP